jgi:hypothetical protein
MGLNNGTSVHRVRTRAITTAEGTAGDNDDDLYESRGWLVRGDTVSFDSSRVRFQ